MFCNGMSLLQDGRVLIRGGRTLKYSEMQPMVGDIFVDNPFLGLPNVSIFDLYGHPGFQRMDAGIPPPWS
jgi:hypothetical protein